MSEAQPQAGTSALVRGVDINLVNLTVLNAALKEAGLKTTAKTSVAERVTLLADHEVSKEGPDNELLDCDHCGGLSQPHHKVCPYCGTGDEQPAPTSPVAVQQAKAKAEGEGKPSKPEKKAKPSKAEAASKRREKAQKKAKEEKAKPAKAALAKVAPATVDRRALDKLDQTERRIAGLVGDNFASAWKLGRELANAFEAGVWKARLDGDGKPAYTGFADWVHQRFSLVPQYARKLMIVSKHFSEKQIREIGPTKLDMVLRVPAELREELLEKAGGTPRAELEQEVRRIAPGATRPAMEGSSAQNQANAAAGRAAPRPTRVVAPNEVTVAIALGRYELPLFARAKSAESGEEVRAKSVAADPHCAHDMQNGVRAHYRLVEDEEGLVLVVEYKRVEEASAAQ